MIAVFKTFILALLLAFSACPILAWGPFAVLERENKDAIKWVSRPVMISISSSLNDNSPNIKYGSNVERAIEQSIASWRPYLEIEIVTQKTGAQNVSPRGKSGDGVNLITIAPTQQNSYFFVRDGETPAKTRIFYSNRTQIVEADIVLNPAQQFSTDGTFGTFDLESVLRHELGHVLGLGHSTAPGSIMYEKIARNGVAQQSAKISQHDIAAIRDLYQSTVADGSCCGAISGRIIGTVKQGLEFEVWALNSETGSLAGSSPGTKNRTFTIGGLPEGKYRLIARPKSPANGLTQFELGEAIVRSGSTTQVTEKYYPKSFLPRITGLGIAGLIADQAIVLKQDTSTSILIAGQSILSSNLRIETDSPFITIENGSNVPVDFSDSFDVISVRVNVEPETPAGNYSICIVNSSEERNCFIGGIKVDYQMISQKRFSG